MKESINIYKYVCTCAWWPHQFKRTSEVLQSVSFSWISYQSGYAHLAELQGDKGFDGLPFRSMGPAIPLQELMLCFSLEGQEFDHVDMNHTRMWTASKDIFKCTWTREVPLQTRLGRASDGIKGMDLSLSFGNFATMDPNLKTCHGFHNVGMIVWLKKNSLERGGEATCGCVLVFVTINKKSTRTKEYLMYQWRYRTCVYILFKVHLFYEAMNIKRRGGGWGF